MAVHVAVDFGTSSTSVAVAVDGREPQLVTVDGQPLISSAVFAATDGTLFVGQEAERQAAIDPSRYEPHPKRRIDEGELLLGTGVVAVQDVVRAVLQRAVGEARRVAGNRGVDLLVLTHPADWGVIRARTLRQAAAGLGHRVVLVPEPVAAAVYHAANHTMGDGQALAVLDLGGGTVDVSVVRRDSAGGQGNTAGGQGNTAGFEVLATKGDPNFGGADIDQTLLEHVGTLVRAEHAGQWRELVAGRELGDRRRRRVLRTDVRSAKETLSRHPYTDVPLPQPFTDAHVTRTDLERLVGDQLRRTVELAAAALTDSRVPRQRLGGVFLVGGSSRIPLIARLVHQRLGLVPVTLDQPESVVARGALRAVTADPEHTGGYHTAGRPGAASGPKAVPGAPKQGSSGPVRSVQGGPAHGGPAQGGPAQGPVAAPQYQATAPPPQSAPPTTAAVGAPARTGARPGMGARRWWLAGGAVVVVAAVVVGLVLGLPGGGGSSKPAASSKPRDTTEQLAVYDYSFDLPKGWHQGGGDDTRRTVTIYPKGSTDPKAVVTVQEDLLRKSSDGAGRAAFLDELGTKVRDAGYVGYQRSTSFAGRNVAYYRGQVPKQHAAIEWYVLVHGKVQVSVGCQYTEKTADRVRDPCHGVVHSMRLRKP